jgi:hypothetical protein
MKNSHFQIIKGLMQIQKLSAGTFLNEDQTIDTTSDPA